MTGTALAQTLAIQKPDIPKPRKEYTGVAARILKFICAGCTPIQAANACGVDPSYVSQLGGETDFQEQVAEKLSKDFETASLIDDNYVEIEKTLSKRLRDLTSYVTNADQVARILKTVTAIPKKVQPKVPLNSDSSQGAVAPVSLLIPIVAKNVFIVSPNSEVVSLNGKELVTLNAKSLDSLLQKKRESVIIEQSKPILIDKPNGKQRNFDQYSDL